MIEAIEATSERTRLQRFGDALFRIASIERARAHVLAGWIVKLERFEQKTRAGRVLYHAAQAAAGIDSTLSALLQASERRPVVPARFRDALIALDRDGDAETVFAAMVHQVGDELDQSYAEAMALGDSLLNTHVIEHLATCQARARSIAGRPTSLATALPPLSVLWPSHADVGRAADRLLWEPVDRAEHARRPAGIDPGLPGAMRPLPLDAIRDPAGIGLVLHHNINGEYTTMELVARCSYEHPDMPAGFHLDLARHASDEARHALALERAAADCGVQYGDHPVYTYTYDALYQFEGIAAGSRDELLWRLLLRATIQEGTSLDDLLFQFRRRSFLGQEHLAEMFANLLADEVFHVRGGLKWCRWLCQELGRDLIDQRERAQTYYDQGLLVRRARFLQSYPEEAKREREHVARIESARRAAGHNLPFQRDVNVPARRAAGYTESELAQDLRWQERSS